MRGFADRQQEVCSLLRSGTHKRNIHAIRKPLREYRIAYIRLLPALLENTIQYRAYAKTNVLQPGY